MGPCAARPSSWPGKEPQPACRTESPLLLNCFFFFPYNRAALWSRGEELRSLAGGPSGSGQQGSVGRPRAERAGFLVASERPQPEDLLLVPAAGEQQCHPLLVRALLTAHAQRFSAHTDTFLCAENTLHHLTMPGSTGAELHWDLSSHRGKKHGLFPGKSCLSPLPGSSDSNKPTRLQLG